MKKYKITCLKAKFDKHVNTEFSMAPGDIMVGYTNPKHRAGDWLNIWFTNPIELDEENIYALRRIHHVQEIYDGRIVSTKIGKFLLEEL